MSMNMSVFAKWSRSTICGVLILGLSAGLEARAGDGGPPPPAIQLGAPFCDNAVLQRDMKLPVWGWSEAGDTVTVQFAGQTKRAKADADGKWMVVLDPLKASFKPAVMTISTSIGNHKSEVSNLLVGEVWMASGQSNMQWKAGKCNAMKLTTEAVDGVAPIREFEITSVFAMLHPIAKATGAWKDGSYADYSAIAYAFAHKLYGELKVPIGILNCSFSQTAIEAWVPREGFRDGEDEYTKAIQARILETDPTTPEHKSAWGAFYKDLEDQIAANDTRVAKGETPLPIEAMTPGNMAGNRDASWLFNGRLNAVIPYAIRGAIWNQGYANMGKGLSYYSNLHSLVRGWRMMWENPELPVYFHQFYTPGNGTFLGTPTMGGTAEMRLGTWLARDIPNTGMASQIDVQGAIHYRSKTVPGQRLALHALKNQYGQKKLVVDGPMFESYTVKRGKVIVSFEHAKGGLVVAETGSNVRGRGEGTTGFADPRVIPDGDAQVKLFYVAGADRVWHPASLEIDGDEVVVSSPAVKKPRGVSYGVGGIGFSPNLYNKALLPATPFMYFDNELVLQKTWPDEKLKIAGEVIDPSTIGKTYEYRKMPLLSTQFRSSGVLQAGKPVTIWGSAVHDWGHEADGEAVITFSFAGVEKTIPVSAGMKEWQVTLPPMKASAEAKTLKVTYSIDGELVHERVATNMVIGDVYYVGAPSMKMAIPSVNDSGQIVRVIKRQAKRSAHSRPSRFSVCVSTTPLNRFASKWVDTAASGLAGAIGHSVAAKTGNPVGIIFMQSSVPKGGMNPQVNSWIAPDFLNQAPSLMPHYKTVGSLYPGNPYYNKNILNYIAAWKTYWSEYIPEMIETKAVPDGTTWGTYPSLTGSAGDSKATQTYNVMVHSFGPAALKGIIFLASDAMVAEDQGENLGAEMSALANCFKSKFGGEDVPFVYTMPSAALAPKVSAASGVKGDSSVVEVSDWSYGAALSQILETLTE